MLIASDAGSDEDRRCNAEVLAREINRLDSLDAFELIDGERVAIHAAATVAEVCEITPTSSANQSVSIAGDSQSMAAHLRLWRCTLPLMQAATTRAP